MDAAFSEQKPAQYASESEKASYMINIHNKLKEKIDPKIYKKAMFHLHHGMGREAEQRKLFYAMGKLVRKSRTVI